ncbi:uncharacterized protein F4817DRAFT_368303 [Daldinia loculata]|uniref:uncharacterized protein n=1 Tax=Daldinia loculata TaxID=103429 RepID=UPI0020C2C15F|nr:uncharacterized protein F4817DRAFT_368303 [Daldinia loculata]KAI1643582.1 hypothetical protein F4817DRAFT_368303 [Daldinia loculata]
MYSSGAVAGIAIGCAFASAAIVSAVFLLVHRRRPNLKPTTPEQVPRLEYVHDHLLQAVGHKELRREFSGLETLIKAFAFNYFHTQPVDATTVDTDKIHAMLGAADNHSSSQWSTQLCDTTNRITALRTYIARVLLARVDPRGPAETTLLPVDIVRCFQTALLKNHPPLLLESWRVTTATVLAGQYPQNKLAEGDPRADNIKRTVADLLDALQPFRTKGNEESSILILEEMGKSFAVLGFKLFSHINTIEVVWPPSSATQVVLFPALVQYRPTEGYIIVTIREASFY